MKRFLGERKDVCLHVPGGSFEPSEGGRGVGKGFRYQALYARAVQMTADGPKLGLQAAHRNIF